MGKFKLSFLCCILTGLLILLSSGIAFAGDSTILNEDKTLTGDLTVDGNLDLVGATLNLDGHKLTVNGDVVLSSGSEGTILDIAGGTLNVTGSLIQQSGELKVNFGTINISGDYGILTRSGSKGSYSYGTSNGWLTMQSPGGTVNVDGNFVIDSTTYGYLEAGTMNIKGNFTQKSSTSNASPYSFNASEGHKVVLCGTGEQDVSFDDPTESGFGMLDITNSTTRDIVFKTPVRGWTLEQDLKIKGDLGLADKQMSLNEHHLTVTGDVVVSSSDYGALDIAGGALDVTGSLIQQAGELKVDSGSIHTIGDYRVQSRNMSGGTYVYGTSNGWLTMQSPGGAVNVDGSFIIDSTTYGYLEAGTMNIKGNFTQKSSTSNASPYSFNASEGHKVVLCGTGEQDVSFDDPTDSGFGTLVILSPVDKATQKDRVKFLTNYTYKAIDYAPQLRKIGDKTVSQGMTLSFKLELLKANNSGQVVYSASNLPKGANFNASTATFTWKPDSTQIGTYPKVHFSVTEGYYGDSEDITITVTGSITQLDSVKDLSVSSTTSSQVNLTWSPVNNAAGYKIYRSATANGIYKLVGKTSKADAISYSDTKLKAGTTYYYKVSAINAKSESDKSSAVAATTKGLPPAAVTGLKVSIAGKSEIDLKWKAVSGATSYNIYRSTSAKGTFELEGSSTSNTYADIDLAAGSTFYYKVSAVNDNGEGKQSSAAKGTTKRS